MFVPAGSEVQIPIVALHMDPTYYPNSWDFVADRFDDQETKKRDP